MNTSKVEICGVNTALLPVLNEEQKTQLLLAAKAGNSEARAQMIQGNLRLVLSVAEICGPRRKPGRPVPGWVHWAD